MDRDLPLKPTLFFLACLILAIGTFLYFSPATMVPPIGQIFKTNDGAVIALEKDKLINLSESNDVTDLSPYVNGAHVGQIIPLASGELIINARGQSQNIWINMKRLFRASDTSGQPLTSLLKCDSQINRCQSWGSDGLVFNMGWSGLALKNGQIIINDSSRHRVLLLSAEGNLLSELDGFKFPNHAVEVDKNIWIVDTNHHQLVELSVEGSELLRTGTTIKLRDYSGIKYSHDWPSIAYLDAEQHWWVMMNDSGMAYPGIYRLNADKTTTQIASEIEDATTMLVDGDQLYIAEYPDNAIWQFDIQTLSGTQLNNADLQQVNNIAEKQAGRQKLIMWSVVGVLILAGVSGLFFAIKGSTPVANPPNMRFEKELEKATSASQKMAGIIWISKNPKLEKKMIQAERAIKYGLPLMLILTIGSLLSLVLGGLALSVQLIFGYLLIVILFIPAYLFSMRAMQGFIDYELGVENNYLIVQHNKANHRTIVLPKDIAYTKNAIYADGKIFPFKNPRYGFAYDIEKFKQYVLPLLKQSERINEWEMFKKQLGIGK